MKTTSNKKSNWLYQNRLKIVILLFLVVLPLLLIPGIYITQYVKSEPVLFENKSAEVINLSQLKVFNLDYEITQIKEPNSELKNGYYTIKYTLTKEQTTNVYKDIKVTFQLSTKWAAYNSANSQASVVLGQEKSSSIVFNFDTNKNVLPLVKPAGPYLYALITYNEEIFNDTVEKKIYVKLPMDFTNTVIIPA
ncbi:MAG TPA: hypothetical protein VJY66_00665 [Acholeplasma sp.]|nr:hypothetical protein [Acholeplasma sp.]